MVVQEMFFLCWCVVSSFEARQESKIFHRAKPSCVADNTKERFPTGRNAQNGPDHCLYFPVQICTIFVVEVSLRAKIASLP